MQTVTNRGMAGRFVPLVLLVAASLLAPKAVRASGTVTNCDEASLRAAMVGGGTVTFACDGIVTLTQRVFVTNNTVFDATGRNVALSGNGSLTACLYVFSGVTAKLINLQIVNCQGCCGAAGIASSGFLEVVNCTFSNNVATGSPAMGGAILQQGGGSLTINGSTFVNNYAYAGGAIANDYVLPGGPIRITNCTFYGNSAIAGAAIWRGPNGNPSTAVTIVNCTFLRNTNTSSQAGTILNFADSGGTITLVNSIVAGGYPSNFWGGLFVDGGHNFISDTSFPTTNNSTKVNTDPLLGPLTDNGGPTLTMALLPGSPAIDAGDDAKAPPVDQTGQDRLYGFASDVGAFERPFPYFIKGRAFVPGNQAGVTVSANGGFQTPLQSEGVFVVRGLTNPGSYLVSVSAPGASFTPTNLTAPVGTSNAQGLVFFQHNALLRPGRTAGKLGYTFAGPGGQVFRLLRSSNFVNWVTLTTNSVPASGVGEFEEATPGASPVGWYRTISP